MNPFRKKPPDDDGTTFVSITITQLKWNFLYDMGLAGQDDIVKAAGLTRVSDEVDEMEKRASVVRIAEITCIDEIITRYAMLTADCMVAVSFTDKEEPDPEHRQQTWEVFRTVAYAAITGFLASFLDLGMLHAHYPTGYSDE